MGDVRAPEPDPIRLREGENNEKAHKKVRSRVVGGIVRAIVARAGDEAGRTSRSPDATSARGFCISLYRTMPGSVSWQGWGKFDRDRPSGSRERRADWTGASLRKR